MARRQPRGETMFSPPRIKSINLVAAPVVAAVSFAAFITVTIWGTVANLQPAASVAPGQVVKTLFQVRFPDGVGATITAFAVLPDGTKTQSADVMGAPAIDIMIDDNHVVHRNIEMGNGCYGYDVIIEPLNDAGFLHEIFSRPRFRVSFQPYSIAKPEHAKACAAVSLPSGPLEPQTVDQGDVIPLEIAANAQTRVKFVDEITVSRL